MKRTIQFLFLLAASASFGQSLNQLRELANEYYDSKKYLEAADFYERIHEVAPNDTTAHLRLALSLYNSLNYSEAKNEFKALLSYDSASQESLYYYGALLKTEGFYKQADSIFNVLLKLPKISNQYKSLGKFQKEGCVLGIRMLKVKDNHNLKPSVAFNSPDNDFGLVQNKAGVVAMSTSSRAKKKQYFDGQYGGFLPNIIAFKPNGSSWEKTSSFNGLNNQWAQGAGCFSSDGLSFYFTSCEKNTNCKIWVSQVNADGNWSNARELSPSINLEGFDSKQPNLSVTSDTLFFVSNRPNGLGGEDIWMSLKVTETDWSPPINLGATINTKGDEVSPHYSSLFNALLFSSNGHVGYGGYDIYLAKGRSFYSPDIYNIGPSFNSPFDDNYFTLGRNGFLSSNRGQNNFDIFEFDYDDEKSLLSSFMKDDALVDLFLHESTSLDLHTFRLEEFEDYHVLIPRLLEGSELSLAKGDYQRIVGNGQPESLIRATLSDSLKMLTRSDEMGRFEIKLVNEDNSIDEVMEGGVPVDFRLSPMRFNGFRYEFEKIYFDFDEESLRDESKETLQDLIKVFRPENIAMVDIHTHTDHIGDASYNYGLSEERGLSILDYLKSQGLDYSKLRIFPKGESTLLTTSDDWYSRLFNRRAELVVYVYEPVSFPRPNVFIVRKDAEIQKVSASLGIPIAKLWKWNGLRSNKVRLQEGQVIRIFDPKHLVPNYSYLIPEEDAGKSLISYTVKAGETILDIADRFGVVEEVLMETNYLLGTTIQEGDEIVIFVSSKSNVY